MGATPEQMLRHMLGLAHDSLLAVAYVSMMKAVMVPWIYVIGRCLCVDGWSDRLLLFSLVGAYQICSQTFDSLVD